MRAYFVKYYGNEFALIKMEAKGKLNAGGAKAYIYSDGKWVESPDHVSLILNGGDYDEISATEAAALMRR